MADKKNAVIQQLLLILLGTALFVVITTIKIPIRFVPDTELQLRAAVLAFFSAVFGPIVGCAIGFLGHTIGDVFFYGSVWWSWVIPDAIFGLFIDLFSKYYKINECSFGIKQGIIFNILQVVGNILSWAFLAPVLDIIFYKETGSKVFLQGFTAAITNVITVGILGTCMCWGHTRIMSKVE